VRIYRFLIIRRLLCLCSLLQFFFSWTAIPPESFSRCATARPWSLRPASYGWTCNGRWCAWNRRLGWRLRLDGPAASSSCKSNRCNYKCNISNNTSSSNSKCPSITVLRTPVPTEKGTTLEGTIVHFKGCRVSG
jgi:hypothetical protein